MPTDAESIKARTEAQQKWVASLSELHAFAKTVVPVLDDHSLKNLARELGAKIFQVDVAQEEFVKLAREELIAFAAALKRGLQP